MLSLRDMQILAETTEYTIEDTRKDLGKIVDLFQSQHYHEKAMQAAFVQERQLPMWLVKESRIFFVDENTLLSDLPEELQAEALGFVKNKFLLFSGRLVYSVMDVKGQVMGFCGWDKFIQPKYLDSRNHGYKAKETTLYGMEKLPEYYKSGKPVYLVEGIVCCLYLRSIGLQALASLGSHLTPYVIQILSRFGRRLIVIPDNDNVGKSSDTVLSRTAGESYVYQVKKCLPNATVIQSSIAKDVDDTRKLEDHKYEELFKNELNNVACNPYMFFSTIQLR